MIRNEFFSESRDPMVSFISYDIYFELVEERTHKREGVMCILRNI